MIRRFISDLFGAACLFVIWYGAIVAGPFLLG